MEGPRFKVGSKVYAENHRKYGEVLEVWWDEMEWRYRVRHSGWDWSIPESALVAKKGRNGPSKSGGNAGTKGSAKRVDTPVPSAVRSSAKEIAREEAYKRFLAGGGKVNKIRTPRYRSESSNESLLSKYHRISHKFSGSGQGGEK